MTPPRRRDIVRALRERADGPARLTMFDDGAEPLDVELLGPSGFERFTFAMGKVFRFSVSTVRAVHASPPDGVTPERTPAPRPP